MLRVQLRLKESYLSWHCLLVIEFDIQGTPKSVLVMNRAISKEINLFLSYKHKQRSYSKRYLLIDEQNASRSCIISKKQHIISWYSFRKISDVNPGKFFILPIRFPVNQLNNIKDIQSFHGWNLYGKNIPIQMPKNSTPYRKIGANSIYSYFF